MKKPLARVLGNAGVGQLPHVSGDRSLIGAGLKGAALWVVRFGTDASQPIVGSALRQQEQESCPSISFTTCKSDHFTPLTSISDAHCP